ncbi:MAG: hypothetical protein WC640_00645 [Candidatus Paceibacterota bacterium]|jgi:hypothetical protein
MKLNQKSTFRIILATFLLLVVLLPSLSFAAPPTEEWKAANKWAPRSSAWSTLKAFLSSATYYATTYPSFGYFSAGKSASENIHDLKLARIMASKGPNGEQLTQAGAEAYLSTISDATCTFDANFSMQACVGDLMAVVGTELTKLVGWLLIAAGQLLDLSVSMSILSARDWFGTGYKSIGGIVVAWRVFRDLANLCFVFVLLYIALGTVFELKGMSDPKKMIVGVVTMALLVNFSGFFTRIVIDASNVVAYEFYSQMSGGSGLATGDKWGLGIGGKFVSKLDLTNYLAQSTTTINTFDNNGNVVKLEVPTSAKHLSIASIIVQSFGNIILISVASFVLLAAAVLFLARTIFLIFLYILSPLAFVSKIIPGLNYFDKWLKKLLEQSFFAPAFLIPLYVVFLILDKGITSLAGGNGGPMILILLDFLLIGLMFGCIIIAKSFGAVGAGLASKVGKGLGWGAIGAAGAYGIGRAASRLARSEQVQGWAANSRVGMGARRTLNYIGDSGFGTGTKGYQARQKARQEGQQQRAASFTGPDASAQRATYMSRLFSAEDRNAYYRSLSAEDKATVEQQLRTQGRGVEADRLLSTLGGGAARTAAATSWRGVNQPDRMAHLGAITDQAQLNNLYEGLNPRERAELEDLARGTPQQARIDAARTAFNASPRATAAQRAETVRETGRVERMHTAEGGLDLDNAGRATLADPGLAFNAAWAANPANAAAMGRINGLRAMNRPEFVEFANTHNNLFDGTHRDIYPYFTSDQLRGILTLEGVSETERNAIREAINLRRGPDANHYGTGGHHPDAILERAYQYLNNPTQGGGAF